ncbi:MAG: NUDIX hydrolase [Candidatus Aenigmarchaeota archaeon]|nr:NUDIX hydrolase [Candidatus Aenigmarchaeota archaeon]
MKTFYYIEKDGQIFLVERDGILCLPEKEEIPFEFKQLKDMGIKEAKIIYCEPKLDNHPHHWPHKDTIPTMNADPLVRLAVNRSLVRHASDAIIVKDGKVLMVKASRGILPGTWDLPGGFINYGESPEESLIREVKEEIGLKVQPQKLFWMGTENINGFYFMVFIYLCEIVEGEIKPDPTEISDVDWLPLDKAIKSAEKQFVKKSLEHYKKSL